METERLGLVVRGDVAPFAFVRELQETAGSEVVGALASVLASHRAASVAGQVGELLTKANNDLKGLQKAEVTARGALADAEDGRIEASAAYDLAVGRKRRALADGDRDKAPDVEPLVVVKRDAEAAAKQARSDVGMAGRRVLVKEREIRRLHELADALGRVGSASPDVLAVLSGALGG